MSQNIVTNILLANATARSNAQRYVYRENQLRSQRITALLEVDCAGANFNAVSREADLVLLDVTSPTNVADAEQLADLQAALDLEDLAFEAKLRAEHNVWDIVNDGIEADEIEALGEDRRAQKRELRELVA